MSDEAFSGCSRPEESPPAPQPATPDSWSLHREVTDLPDGRRLTFYSRQPADTGDQAVTGDR